MRMFLKICLISLIGFGFLFIFPSAKSGPNAVVGQNCQPELVSKARSSWLVTAREFGFSTIFGNPAGICVIGGQQAGLSEIQSYESLKDDFYDGAKSITGKVQKNPTILGNATQANIPLSGTINHLYYIDGSLTLSGVPTGANAGVIFVKDNLEITADYLYGTNSSGTIFVVAGDIFINPGVRVVNAVLIAQGTIYTAATPLTIGSCTNSYTTTYQDLTINGSLISLGTAPIKLCRNLADNNNPAEIIVTDAKFLPLFKELFATDYTARVEDQVIGSYGNIAPTAPPTIGPTATPSTGNPIDIQTIFDILNLIDI